MEQTKNTQQNVGVEDSNSKYSIDTIWENENEKRQILKIVENNLDKIGEKFIFNADYQKLDGEPPVKFISEYFTKIGGYVVNKDIGKIELTKNSAKTTVFHGFGSEKLAVVPQLKEIIENSNVVNITKNYGGKGIDRYTLACKGYVSGKPCIVAVVIKSYPNNKNLLPKFYLHEVGLIKENSQAYASQTMPPSETTQGVNIVHKPDYNTIISSDKAKSNMESEQSSFDDVVDNNNELHNEFLEQTKNTQQNVGVEDSNSKYSIDTIWENENEERQILKIVENNLDKIGEEFIFNADYQELGEKRATDFALDYFDKFGKYAVNKEIGKIELTKRSAKSTMLHGFSNEKIAVVPQLKEIIENSNIVNVTKNYEGKGIDRYTLACKGYVSGKPCIVAVVIKSYPNNKNLLPKFYLHEVGIIKKGSQVYASTTKPLGEKTQSVNLVHKPDYNTIISSDKAKSNMESEQSSFGDVVGNNNELHNEFLDQTKNNQGNVGVEELTDKNGSMYLLDNKSEPQIRFERLVDQIKDNTYNGDNTLVIGATPSILQKIGFNALPITITQKHIYSIAVSKQQAIKDNRYDKNSNYHNLGWDNVKNIHSKISNPLMVIAHPDFVKRNNKMRDSTHKAIVLVDLSNNGRQVIAPILVDAETTYNGNRIDTNLVATYFDKKNYAELIREAIALESSNRVGFYYLDLNNKKTQALIKNTGNLMLDGMPWRLKHHLGSGTIIRRVESNVNKKINKITQSMQFIRWFGDWQNTPKEASKVVDENGEPLVVYHGTNASNIEVFDTNKFNSNESSGDYVGEGFFFTNKKSTALKYGENVISAYLNIKNPLVINSEQDAKKFRNSFLNMYKNGDSELRNLIGGDYDYFSLIEENPAFVRNELQKRGYDGLIDNIYGQYAVFNSNQVKSATDNIGLYDENNPNINYLIDEDIDNWDVSDEELSAIDFSKVLSNDPKKAVYLMYQSATRLAESSVYSRRTQYTKTTPVDFSAGEFFTFSSADF